MGCSGQSGKGSSHTGSARHEPSVPRPAPTTDPPSTPPLFRSRAPARDRVRPPPAPRTRPGSPLREVRMSAPPAASAAGYRAPTKRSALPGQLPPPPAVPLPRPTSPSTRRRRAQRHPRTTRYRVVPNPDPPRPLPAPAQHVVPPRPDRGTGREPRTSRAPGRRSSPSCKPEPGRS